MPIDSDGPSRPPVDFGKYYLTGPVNDWDLEEMEPDPSNPGSFHKTVTLSHDGGFFQIVRNMDWNQMIYPSECYGDSDVLGEGPDDMGADLYWQIGGKQGQEFLIEFQRIVESDSDVMKV